MGEGQDTAGGDALDGAFGDDTAGGDMASTGDAGGDAMDEYTAEMDAKDMPEEVGQESDTLADLGQPVDDGTPKEEEDDQSGGGNI
jgi:hypothetical protein